MPIHIKCIVTGNLVFTFQYCIMNNGILVVREILIFIWMVKMVVLLMTLHGVVIWYVRGWTHLQTLKKAVEITRIAMVHYVV